MNTKRALKWGLVTAATTCAIVTAAGCELLVDFDRSKIPSEGGAEDVTMPPDGPVGEAGPETGRDAPSEASEAGMGDAPEETTGDAPEEMAAEGGGDAPAEAAPEAGPEGGDASDGAMGAAAFTIAPATVNYGTVATGRNAAYAFTVTNTGTASGTPTVTRSGTNSGDFTTSGCTAAVAMGATCTLTVTFAPGGTGTRGPATISVGATSSASVTGNGAAAGTLTIAPTTQDFGAVTNGNSSAEFAFTVTNGDAVNGVTLGTPNVDGQDAAGFIIDADGGAGQCSGTLAPSATCTLFLHFAPNGAAGKAYYGSLSISGTATDGGSAPGTTSASLTGRAN